MKYNVKCSLLCILKYIVQNNLVYFSCFSIFENKWNLIKKSVKTGVIYRDYTWISFKSCDFWYNSIIMHNKHNSIFLKILGKI